MSPYLTSWREVRRLACREHLSDTDLKRQAIAALTAGQVLHLDVIGKVLDAPEAAGLPLRVFLVQLSRTATIETDDPDGTAIRRRVARDLEISGQRVGDALEKLTPALRAAGLIAAE